MQVKVMEFKNQSHKNIIQEEIHSTNQHISYINQLIAELQCKMDINSVPNVNQDILQSTCYRENIADLQLGLGFWKDKVKNIDVKLKTNLLERRNLKNEIYVFLNELNELKTNVERISTQKSDDITHLEPKKQINRSKNEQNIGHSTKRSMSQLSEVQSQSSGEDEKLTKSTNNSQTDTAESNLVPAKNDSQIIEPNLHSNMKTNLLQENNSKERDKKLANTGDEFETFDNLQMKPVSLRDKATNTQKITTDNRLDDILHSPCDVATQTDFKHHAVKHDLSIGTQEMSLLPDIQRYTDTLTNKTYKNIFLAKLRDSNMKTDVDYGVPVLSKQVYKPIFSHTGNIYQTMAINSEYLPKKCTKVKVNNSQIIQRKRLSENRTLYHDKDLDLLWPEGSNRTFHNSHKENMSNLPNMLQANSDCLQNQGDLCEAEVPTNSTQYTTLPKDQAGIKHKRKWYTCGKYPFSICSTEHGGTWVKKPVYKIPDISTCKSNYTHNADSFKLTEKEENSSFPKNLSIGNNKIKVTNDKCDSDTIRSSKSKTDFENPRITPISVRIIRKLESDFHNSLCSVKQKLSPIKQKKLPTKYPISPKYRKPRSYCSAFIRKKKLALKQKFC